MKNDLSRLLIELDYGEIINFNNDYFAFAASEENFQKYNKKLIGSLITLPVFLLRHQSVSIKTSEQFLKFPIIKKPKKINDLLERGELSKFIDTKKSIKLNSSEKKIISIFKKLNFLPFLIFLKKKNHQE